MKELEKVFIGRGEVKGFYFEQVAKSDKVYLYRLLVRREPDLTTRYLREE